MHVSPRGALEVAIGIIGTLSAFAGWVSSALAVGASDGSWVSPSLWFSLSALCFLSAAALYRGRRERIMFVSAMSVPSLLFAPYPFHVAFIVLAVWILLAGMRRIRDDLSSRLRIVFRRSMGAGVFSFSLAVSLLVASGYYAHIRSSSWQDLVPRFSLGEGGGDVVLRIAGTMYPELGKIRDGGMTVDRFLADVRDKESYSGRVSTDDMEAGNDTEPYQERMEEALSIAAGRSEIGRLIGREVSGDERMSDVLSEALRHKTIAFLSAKKAEENLPSGVLPFILSLLLFVTVLSVASLLQWFWVAASAGIMRALIRAGVLSVDRIPVEQESLR